MVAGGGRVEGDVDVVSAICMSRQKQEVLTSSPFGTILSDICSQDE